eukprot:1749853-Alexandrium_andersonii.AAC.1
MMPLGRFIRGPGMKHCCMLRGCPWAFLTQAGLHMHPYALFFGGLASSRTGEAVPVGAGARCAIAS